MIPNCIICETLVPELERQLDKAKDRINTLKIAVDHQLNPPTRPRLLQLIDENTHLKREIQIAEEKFKKAIQLLSIATDEGMTWHEDVRLKFMKQVAALKV